MKALPFPCIRPAQDRVLEALPAMGSILSGNDALRGALADGLMLKDPGAAYYVYECSGEPGRVTGVVAICPVNVLTGSDEAAAESVDALAAARAITELKVQPRPVTLAYEASPVMNIILGAAKEGASLYAVTDPAGSDQETVMAAAMELDKVRKAAEGMTVVKTILVKDKLMNLIVKPAK